MIPQSVTIVVGEAVSPRPSCLIPIYTRDSDLMHRQHFIHHDHVFDIKLSIERTMEPLLIGP